MKEQNKNDKKREMELHESKEENYKEFLSDEEWFYNKLESWFPNKIYWNTDEIDKYKKYDYTVNNCFRIEFESTTNKQWSISNSPPNNWYRFNLLHRKCEKDYWDLFIKVSEDKSTFYALTGKCLERMKLSPEYKSAIIMQNSTNRCDDAQNCFDVFPLSFYYEFQDGFFFDDWNRLQKLIDDKAFLHRRIQPIESQSTN